MTLFTCACSSVSSPFPASPPPQPLSLGLFPTRSSHPAIRWLSQRWTFCTPGYTKLVRAVPAAVKREVYAACQRRQRKGVCCEVDHLISLELGGSNRITNLWPEPYDITWNAHVKDRLENRLHEMVCAGQLDLATAQKAIATDWIAAYKRYENSNPDSVRAKRRRE